MIAGKKEGLLKSLIFGQKIKILQVLKKNIIIFCFLIFQVIVLSAQIEEKTIDFQFDKLEDKIILSTDKDLYLSGEQLWFSAFYLQKGKLSGRELSKVLYVELFNATNDIIWQGKFSIDQNQSSGKIELPAEIVSGTYFLRAYTQLQKNKVPESFFTKAIYMVNPSVPLPSPNLTGEEITISAGNGKLIQNQENFIVIKLQQGLVPLLQTCWISDQYDNLVANPVLFNNGLAYTYLTPVDTLQYILKLAFTDGDTLVRKLPEHSHSGIDLQARIQNGILHLKIINTTNKTENHENGRRIRISDEEKMVLLDTAFFSNEINLNGFQFNKQFMLCELLDSEEKTLARKYIIVPNNRVIKLQVQTDKAVYGQREKVELTIHNDTLTPKGLFSIAVIEKGSTFQTNSVLPSYLISNPVLLPFYLESNPIIDSFIQKQLDIICQLNSSPFKEIFPGKQSLIQWPPETNDVSITALLRDKKTKAPVSGRTVFVSVLGDEPQLHVNKTKQDGRVYFSLTHSTDKKDVFLSAQSTNDEDIELLILNDFSAAYPVLTDVPLDIDTTYRNLLEENWKAQQVELQYKVLENYKLEKNLPPTSRFGKPDYHVETKDFIELTNVEELFKEVVPYTRLKKKAGEYYFEVMDPAKNVVYNDPLILVDDVPVFNYSALAQLPFPTIESVDVYNKQYVYGDFVFNGIVLINTKTDNFAGLLMPYGSVFAVFQTITPEIGLQFPEYHSTELRESSLPDFRTLLYWNPEVQLSGDTLEFSFFTSDYSGEYEIIVRGISQDGIPCGGYSIFKVEQVK